ncbi:hypothetical protein Tco_1515604 [Tanacetum coccineum]
MIPGRQNKDWVNECRGAGTAGFMKELITESGMLIQVKQGRSSATTATVDMTTPLMKMWMSKLSDLAPHVDNDVSR